MLIKINETGSIFNNAIEFIKERHNIKTSSKAATEAILNYEGLVDQVNQISDLLIIEREKVEALEETIEKTKMAIRHLKNLTKI
jgi:hypothetical protein